MNVEGLYVVYISTYPKYDTPPEKIFRDILFMR